MLFIRILMRLAAIFLLNGCSDPHKEVLQLKDCKDENEYLVNSKQLHLILKNDETSGSYLLSYLAAHCMSNHQPFLKRVMALPNEITIEKAIEEGKIRSSLGFFYGVSDKISPPIDQKAVERWRQAVMDSGVELPEFFLTKKAKNFPSWDLSLSGMASVTAIKGVIVFYDEFGDELFRSEVYIPNDPRQHQVNNFPIQVPSEKIRLLDGSSLANKGACFAPGLRILTTQGVEIATNFPYCSQ
jgi:hypothetical protein